MFSRSRRRCAARQRRLAELYKKPFADRKIPCGGLTKKRLRSSYLAACAAACICFLKHFKKEQNGAQGEITPFTADKSAESHVHLGPDRHPERFDWIWFGALVWKHHSAFFL
jgi:hypothetical protein